MTHEIKNFGTKSIALRRLVADAAYAELHPFELRNTNGLEFDGFEDNFPLTRLVDVLKTTDALHVLDALLNGDIA